MTRADWASIAGVLSAAVGRDFSEQQAEVYFDLLADLPVQAVQVAAKLHLLENSYPTLPTVGALRKLATAVTSGSYRQTLAIEAWETAWRAVGRYGLSRERDALASMQASVAKTVAAIGWRSLCDARLDDLDTIRAHFLKSFEAVAGREQRQALLPASMHATIEAIGIKVETPPLDNRSGAEIFKALTKRKDSPNGNRNEEATQG